MQPNRVVLAGLARTAGGADARISYSVVSSLVLSRPILVGDHVCLSTTSLKSALPIGLFHLGLLSCYRAYPRVPWMLGIHKLVRTHSLSNIPKTRISTGETNSFAVCAFYRDDFAGTSYVSRQRKHEGWSTTEALPDQLRCHSSYTDECRTQYSRVSERLQALTD